MDRLTEAAGMLRISGLANRANKLEQPQLRRVAPEENLRQKYQEQESRWRAPRTWWWNNTISNRIAQLQNVIYADVVPLQEDQRPPPPLRHVEGVDNLRERFQQDEQRQAQPPQPELRRVEGEEDLRGRFQQDAPRGQNNDQSAPPRGILRRRGPVRDLRVRFADGVAPGGLRRRPRMSDLRGRYQADADDVLE